MKYGLIALFRTISTASICATMSSYIYILITIVFILSGFFRYSGISGAWEVAGGKEYIFTTAGGIMFLMGFLSFMLITKFGESLMNFVFTSSRELLPNEEERINPIVENLKYLYLEKFNEPLDIRLNMVDSFDRNGYAMGHSLVTIYVGSFDSTTDEELSGIIAHEIGHLHYRDSGFSSLMFTFGNLLTSLFPSSKKSFMPNYMSGKSDEGSLFIAYLIIIPLFLIMLAPFLVPIAILFVSLIITGITTNKLSWWQEYRADAFAAELGFKDGIISFLEKLAPLDQRPNTGFLARFEYSHPATNDRIRMLLKSTNNLWKEI